MGLSKDDQQAIRAALGFGDSAQPRQRTNRSLVDHWVEDFGLAPGKWMAGTTSDLYWVFLDWVQRTCPPVPPAALPENGGHWRFTKDLRAAGLATKVAVNGRLRAHVFNQAGAQLCLDRRAALGLRPNLNWQLGAMPAELKTTRRRPVEFQDDAYRKHKEYLARNGARLRGKREILARQAIAKSLQLRSR